MPSAILVERSESEGERVKRCDALDLGGAQAIPRSIWWTLVYSKRMQKATSLEKCLIRRSRYISVGHQEIDWCSVASVANGEHWNPATSSVN